MSAYVTLKEISSKETLTDAVFKAKLEGHDGFADVTITVKARTLEDLKRAVPLLRKGAIFELTLTPLRRENASLSDFQVVEV